MILVCKNCGGTFRTEESRECCNLICACNLADNKEKKLSEADKYKELYEEMSRRLSKIEAYSSGLSNEKISHKLKQMCFGR